jgi:hypothetical protein
VTLKIVGTQSVTVQDTVNTTLMRGVTSGR